jgi:ABC-type multidrug transport system ATPase subunit
VTKTYGARKALDRMSFTVPRGALCGFIGPNGAGKTTTFSVVSGFLPPDEGTVDILGEGPFDPWRLKGRLGVLPQDAELGDRHTPREWIAHLAMLQGMNGPESWAEADRVLDVVRLTERRQDRIGSLSHGMRRRVAVASALVGSPELVMLDEPTAGLDPGQARSLREALRALGGAHTLVVSSHNLVELEQICDWVVMIDAGRCLSEGPVSEVTRRGQVIDWVLSREAPLDALHAALPGHRFSHRTEASPDGDLLILAEVAPMDVDADAASLAVMAVLCEAGVAVRAIRRGVSLEERFLDAAESAANLRR